MARTKQLYEDNGVEISKATINVGDEVTLMYSGLLAQSGADSVYAHIGYGDNWEGKQFIPMEKEEDAFKATIKVDQSDKLNVAFKDSVDNWDNNSYQNYSFSVSKRASRSSATSTAKKTATKTRTSGAKSTSDTKSKTAKSAKTTKTTAKKATTAKKSTATKSATKKST